jgi:hypothetical protein
MGRIILLSAALMITAAPASALAKGGTFHLFSAQAASSAASHLGASDSPERLRTFSIGCGRGRYRDAGTSRCVGPADVDY